MSDQTTNDLPIGGRDLVACCAEREALRARVGVLEVLLRNTLDVIDCYSDDDDSVEVLSRIIDAALRGKEPQADGAQEVAR